MKKIKLILLFIAGCYSYFFAQTSSNYIGAGQFNKIKVTSSSNLNGTSAIKTIDGSGLDAEYIDAKRFLAQATLGVDSIYATKINYKNYDQWIDNQFSKPPSLITPMMDSIWKKIVARRLKEGQEKEEMFGPYALHFNYAWWQINMTNTFKNEDLLRQRVALALSEILVISRESNLGDWGESLSGYFDILLNSAFDDYATIVKRISKSLQMGYYLSHLNNPKTNLVANVRPDENFAREIMQLFTVGLTKLNIDGTEKKDSNGKPIPTYDNVDIKEMAKIFTGLHGEKIRNCPDPPCPVWWPKTPAFGLDPYVLEKNSNLIMSNQNHEPGIKTMPDKITKISIPNNGMAEIDSAIQYLVKDPNTAPFISIRLIQQLVKSNPSPDYISRVATIFRNDGKGKIGNMKAVIKAILLDPEARSTNYLLDENNGKLKSPLIRYIQFAKANNLDSDLGNFWNNGYNFNTSTKHHLLSSPTVFNYYSPFFSPAGEVKTKKLVAPEFKLHDASTSINWLNLASGWTSPWPNEEGESGYIMFSWENYKNVQLDSTVFINTTKFESIADNEKLIYELNKVFADGQLGDATLNTLRILCKEIDSNTNPNDTWWFPRYKHHKIRNLIYFIIISPDYSILK
jgi:uncharacterized protein (DUF1800 family)